MKKRLLKLSNENGYFLVATFVILAVLLVFGAVILQITLAEYKNAERDKNQIKAYYLARSGAELTADSIIDEAITAIDSDGNIIPDFSLFSLKEKGKEVFATINIVPIEGTSPKRYEIKSTAEVDEVSDTVILEIKESTLFDKPLFTNEDINLDAVSSYVKDEKIVLENDTYTYNYDADTDTKIYKNDDPTKDDYFQYSPENDYYINDEFNPDLIYIPNVGVESKGNIYDEYNNVDDEYKIENSERDMPPLDEVINWPVWENGMTWPYLNEPPTPNDPLEGNIIDNNSYYQNIKLNNTPLEVNTGTESEIRHLVVDNIDINEEIIIKGDGKLIIYVNETATFQTPNNPPGQLLIFLADGATFNVQANPEFNGFIYGPEATVIMNSPDTTINGSVFVNELNKNKNPDQDDFQGIIEYEPFPLDFFGTSGSLPVDYLKGRWK